ncbi:polysaccharide deacetylase family protein [Microbacteriaceae bacterium 4G12]
MKRASIMAIIFTTVLIIASGCSAQHATKNYEAQQVATIPVSHASKDFLPDPNRKVVYLTFDDGPGTLTPQVLDILDKYQVKGTFFVVGPNAKKYKDFVGREKRDGNYVGMHSMTHDFKKLYTQGHFVNEMKEDQQIIKDIIGSEPQLCRPPFGSMPGLNQKLRDETVNAKLKVWDWTIDSLDWKYNKVPFEKSVPTIVNNVLTHATGKREVVLMHDIHPQSVKALPIIIEKLREKGYDFEVYNEQAHFPLNFWRDNRL